MMYWKKIIVSIELCVGEFAVSLNRRDNISSAKFFSSILFYTVHVPLGLFYLLLLDHNSTEILRR